MRKTNGASRTYTSRKKGKSTRSDSQKNVLSIVAQRTLSESNEDTHDPYSKSISENSTRNILESNESDYGGGTTFELYIKEVSETPLLTIEEEQALVKRKMEGDEKAHEKLIVANLRLVVSVAKKYTGYGLSLMDLINEGNIGLMKGIERYRLDKGAKISTYVVWWIEQSIKRALAKQSRTIRLPVHMVDKAYKVRKVTHKLTSQLGRDPTTKEIADEMGIDEIDVNNIKSAASPTSSLDVKLGYSNDGDISWGDLFYDEDAPTPFKELDTKLTQALLRESLLTLNPREIVVLTGRYGLDGSGEKTLDQVGDKFGVTRERIRQIQEIALKKLRRQLSRYETSVS